MIRVKSVTFYVELVNDHNDWTTLLNRITITIDAKDIPEDIAVIAIDGNGYVYGYNYNEIVEDYDQWIIPNDLSMSFQSYLLFRIGKEVINWQSLKQNIFWRD